MVLQFLPAIISAGASLFGARSAAKAAEQSRKVDITTMSPEARTALNQALGQAGLFGQNAFSQTVDDRIGAIDPQQILNLALANAQPNINALTNSQNQRGAYNSTAVQGLMAQAVAQATTQADIAYRENAVRTQLAAQSALDPFLKLLELDKGSVRKGTEAGNAEVAAGAATSEGKAAGTLANLVFGELFKPKSMDKNNYGGGV